MMNSVNGISGNGTEGTAQMTYHAGLLTIMNHIVAYHVTADKILMPVAVKGTENNLLLSLGTALALAVRPLVVTGADVLSEADTYTLGAEDLIILDNPTFAPVRSDKALLKCRRRSPLRSALTNGKALTVI